MTTEKWVAGGVSWADWFGSELNSLGTTNNAVLSSVQVDNTSALDIFADLSMSLGSVTTGSGSPFIGLFLYPLNEDGTSYGDGRFGSAAAGPPPADYWVGNMGLPASTTGVLTGMVRGIVVPFGKFKLVLWNQAGVALAASANHVKGQTYNRQIS